MNFDNLISTLTDISVLIGIPAAFSVWRGFKNKTYRLSWRLCAALLVSGWLSLYVIDANTYIDEQGFLHEQWPLPVLAMLLLFGGALNLVILGALYGYRFVRERWQLRSNVR